MNTNGNGKAEAMESKKKGALGTKAAQIEARRAKVWELYHEGALGYKEIAEQLGVSIATISTDIAEFNRRAVEKAEDRIAQTQANLQRDIERWQARTEEISVSLERMAGTLETFIARGIAPDILAAAAKVKETIKDPAALAATLLEILGAGIPLKAGELATLASSYAAQANALAGQSRAAGAFIDQLAKLTGCLAPEKIEIAISQERHGVAVELLTKMQHAGNSVMEELKARGASHEELMIAAEVLDLNRVKLADAFQTGGAGLNTGGAPDED